MAQADVKCRENAAVWPRTEAGYRADNDATDINKPADPVRNGNRWRVHAVDTTAEHQRIAARRLSDGARTAFSGDYLRHRVTHGYAVTVHSARASPPTPPTPCSAKPPAVPCCTSR